MKALWRISVEVLVISAVLMSAEYCFSQARWTNVVVPFDKVPFDAKELNIEDIRKLASIYDKYGYGLGSYNLPGLAYDSKTMKLLPFNLRTTAPVSEKPLSGVDAVALMATFRDATASSNNDLEERIRRLENTVNKIVEKCCPRARD